MYGANYDELEKLTVSLERELGKSISSRVLAEDKLQDFLFNCSDEEFLSALEILFSLRQHTIRIYGREYNEREQLLALTKNLFLAINKLFKLDKIGYQLVQINLEDVPIMVIPFNSEYLYQETVQTPRSLLYNAKFEGPLNEFEKALDLYRKDEFDNAIIEATNAYESTLKAILSAKKVLFDEKEDKIPQLIDKIKETKIVEPIFETVFGSFWGVLKNGPNNIRNLSGNAHGQGIKIKKAQKEYADFVLRTVGTYISFLIERYEDSK